MSRCAARLDEGFTLIELMVSSLLSIVVLLVIAGIMVSSTTTEHLVRNVSSATQQGQSATNLLERGIVNSGLGSLTITTAGADQFVTALEIGSAATASTSCAGWYYSAAAKTLSYHSQLSAFTSVPSASALATWTLLASGVGPVTGSTIFTKAGSDQLAFSFAVDAGTDQPVTYQSSVSSRTGVTGDFACF